MPANIDWSLLFCLMNKHVVNFENNYISILTFRCWPLIVTPISSFSQMGIEILIFFLPEQIQILYSLCIPDAVASMWHCTLTQQCFVLNANVAFQHTCNINMSIFNIWLKLILSVHIDYACIVWANKHNISNICILIYDPFAIDETRMSAFNISAINSRTQNTFLPALALNIGIGCEW